MSMFDKASAEQIEDAVKVIEDACRDPEKVATYPMGIEMAVSALKNFGFKAEAGTLERRVKPPSNRASPAEMFGAAVFMAEIAPEIVERNRKRLSAAQLERIRAATRKLSGSSSAKGCFSVLVLAILVLPVIGYLMVTAALAR